MPYLDTYFDNYSAYADAPGPIIVPPVISPINPELLLATDRFWAALADHHDIHIRCEVITGPEDEPIDISPYFSGGTLTVAKTDIRRVGTISFDDQDDGIIQIVPKTPDSLLAPYGNELQLWYGIPFADGTTESIPIGRFRIIKPTAQWPKVTLELRDRAWNIQKSLLEDSYTIAKGTPVSDAIRALAQFVYPQVVMDIPEVSEVTPKMVIDAFEDPWAHLQDMAVSVGHELFFDIVGTMVMPSEQDLLDIDPVWTFDGVTQPDASNNIALYDPEISWDTEDAVNAVVAVGESASNAKPVRGVAKDTDPNSPTRYGGKFGRHVMSVSSVTLTSDGQAQTLARTTLQRNMGLAEAITIPTLPIPLEPGVPIRIRKDELGIDSTNQVDSYPFPLGPGTQSIQTRMRRVVLGGDP